MFSYLLFVFKILVGHLIQPAENPYFVFIVSNEYLPRQFFRPLIKVFQPFSSSNRIGSQDSYESNFFAN